MEKILHLMLPLVLCIISCGCIDKIQVSPKTHSFVDKLGQTHIFHGTAADNNFGLIHYDEVQLTQLKDWGFNVMRLGFHWHLYEYAPNMYNESYMNSIETLVNTFYEYGIMTILDMHQDLWSPLFCGGHGIPEFYSYPYNDTESYWKYNNLTYPYPHHAPRGYVDNDQWCNVFGKVNDETCNQMVGNTTAGWASSYTTYALGSASQQLYNNYSNWQTYFGEHFWQQVARKFKDNPGVLGYELINEPWIGDSYTHEFLKIPSSADVYNLAPLYSFLNSKILEIDNDTIIFYEPATGGNYYDATPCGFSTGPGGDGYNTKQSLSFHIYCPFIQSDVPIGPIAKNDTIYICEEGDKTFFDIRVDDIERLSTAGFLTEFGAIPMTKYGFELITFMMDLCDKYKISFSYWLLTPSGNLTNPNPEVPYLTRTYAKQIAGIDIERHFFDFYSVNKNFSLIFQLDNMAFENNLTTIVWYSQEWQYTNGIDYDIKVVINGGKNVYNGTYNGYIDVDTSSMDSHVVLRSLKSVKGFNQTVVYFNLYNSQ